jgi:hypothetical protein
MSRFQHNMRDGRTSKNPSGSDLFFFEEFVFGWVLVPACASSAPKTRSAKWDGLRISDGGEGSGWLFFMMVERGPFPPLDNPSSEQTGACVVHVRKSNIPIFRVAALFFCCCSYTHVHVLYTLSFSFALYGDKGTTVVTRGPHRCPSDASLYRNCQAHGLDSLHFHSSQPD